MIGVSVRFEFKKIKEISFSQTAMYLTPNCSAIPHSVRKLNSENLMLYMYIICIL